MTDRKRLVLDANILLRAVFGVRVRSLLEPYEDSVSFYAPDICFEDACKYISAVSAERRIDSEAGTAVLNHLSRLVEIVARGIYDEHEHDARKDDLSRSQRLADCGNFVALEIPGLD